MTGEGAAVGIQPGGRSPAPGALAVVQAFINTHYDLDHEHGAEVLATPADLSRWLARARLTPDPEPADASDLERALVVREGLRSLARGAPNINAVAARLDEASRGASVEVRLGELRFGDELRPGDGLRSGDELRPGDGLRSGEGERGFVPAPGTGISGAIGVLLALTAHSMADGSWSRLKICPGNDCGWAFYDHSRNRSGRWCAMSVCGSRAKARAHYRRHMTGSADR